MSLGMASCQILLTSNADNGFTLEDVGHQISLMRSTHQRSRIRVKHSKATNGVDDITGIKVIAEIAPDFGKGSNWGRVNQLLYVNPPPPPPDRGEKRSQS